MNRIFLVLLILFVGVSGIADVADARLRQPKIKALKGQSAEQQEKDTQECSIIATQKTGVDPALLEMRMKSLQSMYDRYSSAVTIPGKGTSFGGTLPPGRYDQASQVENQMDQLEFQYERYLEVFTEEMEARGYQVR